MSRTFCLCVTGPGLRSVGIEEDDWIRVHPDTYDVVVHHPMPATVTVRDLWHVLKAREGSDWMWDVVVDDPSHGLKRHNSVVDYNDTHGCLVRLSRFDLIHLPALLEGIGDLKVWHQPLHVEQAAKKPKRPRGRPRKPRLAVVR